MNPDLEPTHEQIERLKEALRKMKENNVGRRYEDPGDCPLMQKTVADAAYALRFPWSPRAREFEANLRFI